MGTSQGKPGKEEMQMQEISREEIQAFYDGFPEDEIRDLRDRVAKFCRRALDVEPSVEVVDDVLFEMGRRRLENAAAQDRDDGPQAHHGPGALQDHEPDLPIRHRDHRKDARAHEVGDRVRRPGGRHPAELVGGERPEYRYGTDHRHDLKHPDPLLVTALPGPCPSSLPRRTPRGFLVSPSTPRRRNPGHSPGGSSRDSTLD